MEQEIRNEALNQRGHKILLLFSLLVIAMGIFLFSIFRTIISDRRIPSHNSTMNDRSLRGAIISEDNYTLASSQKTYQAVIHGNSIDSNKKTLFVKLFSIYSGIPESSLLGKFKRSNGTAITGNITLSNNINSKSAMQLKALAYKLRQLNVFHSVKNHNGIEVIYGLDIIENGESRRFPLGDVLSPILGYVGNKTDGKYTRPAGKKGIERRYEEHITSKKNGYFKGKRDVIGAIIHDKNSINMQRVDGLDLHLNIPLAFQRRVEFMIDNMKENIDADEIIVGVMESNTGKVLSLASTERYNPEHIIQENIAALNPKFSEYPYEAGSVVKPFTLAIALDHKVVTPDTWFKTFNGKMKIGKRRTITDDDKFEALTATDIIVHSSNVGISQISWKLTGQEFREGLLKFGIAKPSGIDLSRDLPGQLKPLHLLNHPMHRANSSYGYGMLITFAQLFKGYSAFNNDGIIVTPRIVNYLGDGKGKHYTLEPAIANSRAVSKEAADQVHDILLEAVKRGTGVKAQYPGLEIGGKTGTAHIAKNGHYVREFHSSFYGFANDKEGHKYTIGVLVIRAKKYLKYFAAQSAVPTFKNITEILVEQGNLKPDPQEQGEEHEDIALYAEEKPDTNASIKEETILKKDAAETAKKEEQKHNQSIKSLFKIQDKPKKINQPIVQRKPKPTPAKNKSTHELFNDLF